MQDILLLGVILIFILSCLGLGRCCSELPPGPPALPLIGNIHQLSKRQPWKQFQQWHKAYGPLFTIRAGQVTLVIIGTHEAAKEILGKRSRIYSSRPHFVVRNNYFSKGLGTIMLPYGPVWKQNRALQMSFLNARMCQCYRPLQDLESRQLLFSLLTTNNFEHEIHRYSSSLQFTLLYGKRLSTGEEPELKQMEEFARDNADALITGRWLVDIFPILNYIPRRFARWKKVGYKHHLKATKLFHENAASALKTSSWNWTKQSLLAQSKGVLEQEGPEDLHRNLSKELTFFVGEMFEAGSYTTAGALRAAVLACVSYPLKQRRLQEEVDEYVGSQRLPTFEDIPRLPFTRAFIEEVLRWWPLTPGGVPRTPIIDDHYRGYSIPKGTTVLVNHWSLDMDEKVFSDPQSFTPERWLGNSNLPIATFGFGGRACPGQHLVRSSMMLVIARLLWAFDVAWSEHQEQRSDLESTQQSAFSMPCSFKAVFSVRSSLHEQVVRESWLNSNNNIDSILNAASAAFST